MVKNGEKWYYGIIVGAPGFGGGTFKDEPENGKYHVYIPKLRTKWPDNSNTGYYINIPEADINYLEEYPDGSPRNNTSFQNFMQWTKDEPYREYD